MRLCHSLQGLSLVAQLTRRRRECCKLEFRIFGASIDPPTCQNNRHLKNLKPSCGTWASCGDDAINKKETVTRRSLTTMHDQLHILNRVREEICEELSRQT